MKIPHCTIIRFTMSCFVLFVLFSCSKDSDLLADYALNNEILSVEERAKKEAEAAAQETGEIESTNLVSRTFTFSPTNDAYIQDDNGFDRDIVRLQEEHRTSYLMFDLSVVPGNITGATLQFTIDTDPGDGTVDVFKGNNSDWTEETLSQGNAPEQNTQLATLNATYDIGKTELIPLSASDLTSEKTTLILTHSGGSDLAFASKESTVNDGPKLIINYMAVEGSADIVIPNEVEETPAQAPVQQEVETTPEPQNTETGNQPIDGAYYVTTSGKSSNNGLSEANAWSIEHAFMNAKAGDVVYVKAGNYGAKRLDVDNPGTSSKPIRFIGYSSTPGDVVSTNGPTFEYGDSLDPSKMPLLEGNTSNGEGQGTGITVNEAYVQISNFQITTYNEGLYSSGKHCVIDNIISTELGDFNPSHSYPNGTSNAFLNYEGRGITVNGDYATIKNCFVLNAGAEGFRFAGADNQTHLNNKVYSDDNTNPTDYYYFVTNSDNNSLTNIYVERVGDLEHSGHGLILKNNATNNQINSCNVKNTQIELTFAGVKNNTYRDCHIVGGEGKKGSILIANGANNNTFIDCSVIGASGVSFVDRGTGGASPTNAGNNNTFTNCEFKDAKKSAINFHWYAQGAFRNSAAFNNVFDNCTFENMDTLFEVDRKNYDNTFKNCTFKNIDKLRWSNHDENNSLSLDVDAPGSEFTNCGFSF